jgi:hypothetical protein
VTLVGRGGHSLSGNLPLFPKVDLLVVSEAREWESGEYLRDAVHTDPKKVALVIAHETGEEAGMDNCAQWLRGFVTEVPVKFVETKDQMWMPA